jgi:CO/xanthine dehydrogenase FAD-binding subunit
MATLGGNVCLETRCAFFNQSHDFQFVEPCVKRGGNLCYLLPKGKKCQAIAMADTAPALICLDAHVTITDGRAKREESVADLFTGDSARPLALTPNDILSEIVIPSGAETRGWAFLKLCPRKGLEFATVAVSVVLNMSPDRETCATARIAVGSVAAAPVRAHQAEDLLAGQKLNDELIRAAAHTARDEVRTAPRPGYSRSYLKACVESLCCDGLLQAQQRVQSQSEGHRT